MDAAVTGVALPADDAAATGRQVVEEIYRVAYQRLVFAVYAVSGDLGEAQDVVHEAFAVALGRAHRVGAATAPEAWIRTVAINIARSRFKRRIWLERFLRRWTPPELPGEPALDRVILLAALRKLSPVLRETVALYYLADLSVDEVATTLRVPTGTVKARLARGRTALGAILTPEEGDRGE